MISKSKFQQLVSDVRVWLLEQDYSEPVACDPLRERLMAEYADHSMYRVLAASAVEHLDRGELMNWAFANRKHPAGSVLGQSMALAIQALVSEKILRRRFDQVGPIKDDFLTLNTFGQVTKNTETSLLEGRKTKTSLHATQNTETSGEGSESVYVYGFEHDPDYLKIGLASSAGTITAAYARVMQQIGTSNRALPILHHVFFTDNCAALEKYLHQTLKHRGRWASQGGAGTEWFRATLEEVLEAATEWSSGGEPIVKKDS